jgi:hypothetical protein
MEDYLAFTPNVQYTVHFIRSEKSYLSVSPGLCDSIQGPNSVSSSGFRGLSDSFKRVEKPQMFPLLCFTTITGNTAVYIYWSVWFQI